MYEISELQARVYFVIQKHGPIGPTQIGHHLSFVYDQASGSVTRPIQALVKRGLVRRVAVNKRVVKYVASTEMVPPLQVIGRAEDEMKELR